MNKCFFDKRLAYQTIDVTKTKKKSKVEEEKPLVDFQRLNKSRITASQTIETENLQSYHRTRR
jgi:hypothetical protein